MRRRLSWLAAATAAAVVIAGAVVAVAVPQPAAAVTGSQFNPGNIISDQVFYDAASMNAASAQSFIAQKGASCVAGAQPCLKDYKVSYGAIASSTYCGAIPAASNQLASGMIVAIGQACGVSPKVLIVLLEKEQGLVTGTRPTTSAYAYATGFACPDTAPCSSASSGFFKQVYAAAMQFRVYRAYPNSFNYVAGKTVSIPYSPTASCGSQSVYIQNQATAGLYDYTPYVPNSAALANLTGVGNSCSSYGNRNFWYDFTTWFGSTTSATTDGNIDSFARVAGTNLVAFKGWAFDPNRKTTSINVSVQLTGPSGLIGTTQYVAAGTRTDVASAYSGVGSQHGFGGAIAVTAAGTYQACFSAQWSTGSVLLGCQSASVSSLVANSANIAGSYDTNQPDYNTPRIHERGWAFDKTAPTTSTSVTLVEIDPAGRQTQTTVRAATARADVNKAYPATGTTPVGFDTYVSEKDSGVYTVCAIAKTAGAADAGQTAILGCKSVTFGPAQPTGSFDTAELVYSAGAATVSAHLRGWAIDRADLPESTHMTVQITSSTGKVVTSQQVTASTPRSDLATAFPGAGANHGVDLTVQLPGAGTYSACLTADAMPSFGSVGKSLGCKTLQAVSQVKGSLDTFTATASGSQTVLKATGWAIDFAAPSVATRMDLYLLKPDGTRPGSRLLVTTPRSDLARVYPAAGADHGLSYSATVTQKGTYQLCAWADGLPAFGTPVNSLGCKSVVLK